MVKFLATSVTILALLSASASGHEWEFGKCPVTASQIDFDSERFLGNWYVIEQIDTGSQCLELEFKRKSPTQIEVTKVRQVSLLKALGIDHTNRYSAILDMPTANEAMMRVKWTLNPRKADYTIVDTDYEGHALIFECQQLTPWFHRHSASILSRSATLSPQIVTRMKNILRSSSIDIGEFKKISHDHCKIKEVPQVNIDINRNTFKDIMTTTRTGIEDLSRTIADGFRTVTTTLSSAAATVAGVATGNPVTTSTSVTSTPGTSPTTSQTTTSAKPEIFDIDVRFGGDRGGKEPLDENPDVPIGNPDELQPELNSVDEIFNNIDETDNTLDGNSIPAEGTNNKVDAGPIKPVPVDEVINTVVSGI